MTRNILTATLLALGFACTGAYAHDHDKGDHGMSQDEMMDEQQDVGGRSTGGESPQYSDNQVVKQDGGDTKEDPLDGSENKDDMSGDMQDDMMDDDGM